MKTNFLKHEDHICLQRKRMGIVNIPIMSYHHIDNKKKTENGTL